METRRRREDRDNRSFFASGGFFAIRLDAGGLLRCCAGHSKSPPITPLHFLIIATWPRQPTDILVDLYI